MPLTIGRRPTMGLAHPPPLTLGRGNHRPPLNPWAAAYHRPLLTRVTTDGCR